MTKEITLFKNGLVRSKSEVAQPEFNDIIKRKLHSRWEPDEIKTRTENAINFVANFVPSFKSAAVGGPPLFGAQQIPGDDPNLRVGEVSFPCKSYARIEIVKASSALSVANQIIKNIKEDQTIDRIPNQRPLLDSISKTEIDQLSSELAIQRGYPEALAKLLIDRKS